MTGGQSDADSGLPDKEGPAGGPDEVVNQYPEGTDLLWMAHYRSEPSKGDMAGPSAKLSGTLEKAARRAQEIAVIEGYILQCLRRRY